MEVVFTPEAKKIWESIAVDTRTQILGSTWCDHCSGLTSIGNFSGEIESGLLVLRGQCSKCNNDVARIIGTKKLRSLWYKFLAKKKMKGILKEYKKC